MQDVSAQSDEGRARRAGLVCPEGLWRVMGRLTAEVPANLSGAQVLGDCTLGAFTRLAPGVELLNADIGRYCSIDAGAVIGAAVPVEEYVTTHPIGDDATGLGASLQNRPEYARTALTALSRPTRRPFRVTLGPDVRVGTGALVASGVSVGAGAVIEPGAVVTQDVAAYAVVEGDPAAPTRSRLPEATARRLQALAWWNWDLGGLEGRDYSDPEGFADQMERAIALGVLRPFVSGQVGVQGGALVQAAELADAS